LVRLSIIALLLQNAIVAFRRIQGTPMNACQFGTSNATRFAPHRSGLMHLGHAYSALFAFRLAQFRQGTFHPADRGYDPDAASLEFEDAIIERPRLASGWEWKKPVLRQVRTAEIYLPRHSSSSKR